MNPAQTRVPILPKLRDTSPDAIDEYARQLKKSLTHEFTTLWDRAETLDVAMQVMKSMITTEMLTGNPRAKNLQVDNGFELNDLSKEWDTSEAGSNATIVETPIRSGKYSLRLAGTGSQYALYSKSYLPVNGGVSYFHEAYHRHSGTSLGNSGFAINWYDKDKAYISQAGNSAADPGTTWTRRYGTLVAPSTAVYARVVLYIQATMTAGEYAYFDDIFFYDQATGDLIKDAAITGAKVTDTTLTGSKFENGTITGGKIANTTLSDVNIVGGTITGAKVANSTLGTGNVIDNAITKVTSAFTGAPPWPILPTSTTALYEMIRVSVTTTGAPLLIITVGGISNGSSAKKDVPSYLYRGTTQVNTYPMTYGANSCDASCMMMVDTPAAGTYIYYLYVKNVEGSSSILVHDRSIAVLETKK